MEVIAPPGKKNENRNDDTPGNNGCYRWTLPDADRCTQCFRPYIVGIFAYRSPMFVPGTAQPVEGTFEYADEENHKIPNEIVLNRTGAGNAAG